MFFELIVMRAPRATPKRGERDLGQRGSLGWSSLRTPGSLRICSLKATHRQAVETLVLYGADLRVTSSEKVGNVVDWLCWRTDSRVPDVLELVLRKWASYGDDEADFGKGHVHCKGIGQ